jgi:hypothetical protein
MDADLIVDFPTHQNGRSRSIDTRRSVQFADMSEMYIVDRHDDNEDVDRNDLWCNKEDYSRMRLAITKSVRKVRAMASAGVPISYSGDDGSGSSGACLIGIEHLLTPASAVEVKACRARCVRAVLQQQARQKMNPSSMFGWEFIAIVSFAETRKSAVRARRLGKLHQESI